jgi:hypothetical protein
MARPKRLSLWAGVVPLVFLTGAFGALLLQWRCSFYEHEDLHMQITMNNTLYPGLSAMEVGQSRVDQAATQIASSNIEVSGRSQSSDFQLENLRSVDRSQRSDLSANLVEMAQGANQIEAGARVQKASDEMLGTLIDTYA